MYSADQCSGFILVDKKDKQKLAFIIDLYIKGTFKYYVTQLRQVGVWTNHTQKYVSMSLQGRKVLLTV